MIVSNRQKHNGMSWSNNGSVAFATVSAAFRNNEINSWVHHRDIDFALADTAGQGYCTGRKILKNNHSIFKHDIIVF